MTPATMINGSQNCAKTGELGIVALEKDEDDNAWQTPAQITADLLWKAQSFSGVRFLNERLPAPSAFPRAEHQIDQRTQRQNVAGNDEILQILNRTTRAQRLEAAPQIETQRARQR